jgi:hypothetical protein
MMHSRKGLWLMLPALSLLFLSFGALSAQKEPQSAPTADAVPSTAEEIVTRTPQERQDSLFALIDDNFKLVKPIFEHSCYNCHSSATKYPWYHSLPIIKGMIDKDISVARRRVDFSDGFPFAGKSSTLQILRDIREEIVQGDMPPWDYRLMHWGSLVESARKDSAFAWLDSSIVMIEGFYDAEKIPYQKESPEDKKDAEE